MNSDNPSTKHDRTTGDRGVRCPRCGFEVMPVMMPKHDAWHERNGAANEPATKDEGKP